MAIVVGLDVKVIWWGWQEAAARIGIDRKMMMQLIACGHVEADQTETWVASRDGTESVRKKVWWVTKESALAWARRQCEQASDERAIERKPGEPMCVLYGLLTADDAHELQRRALRKKGAEARCCSS